jgi:hypothetical protein
MKGLSRDEFMALSESDQDKELSRVKRLFHLLVFLMVAMASIPFLVAAYLISLVD